MHPPKAKLFLLLLFVAATGCATIQSPSKDPTTYLESSYNLISGLKGSGISDSGVLRGLIYDRLSGKPCRYASVMVEGEIEKGIFVEDTSGYFEMALPQGTYKATFSRVGNKPLVIDSIKVKAGYTEVVKVYLGTVIEY